VSQPLLVLRPLELGIVEANRANIDATKMPRQAIVGRNCFDVFVDPRTAAVPAMLQAVRHALDTAVVTGAKQSIPLVRFDVLIDGVNQGTLERYGSMTVSPIVSPDGHVELLVLEATDVIDLQQLRRLLTAHNSGAASSRSALTAATLTLCACQMVPGQSVRVAVRDTGVGMKPEVLVRAFEPCFMTKEVGQGSGLGLPMTDGFIKQSGGHINIESAVSAGTTVNLYLPRLCESSAPSAAVESPPVRGAGRQCVLAVEDDAAVRIGAAGSRSRSAGCRRWCGSFAAAAGAYERGSSVDRPRVIGGDERP
jgi:hypothetical protein